MKTKLLTATAAVALLLGAMQPARAALELMLSDGVTTSTIVDQGVGDVNPAVGAVTFVGVIGNFSLNVTTGVSKPIVGSATLPVIDLNSIDVTTTAGGTLTIKLWDTGFIGSGGPITFLNGVGGTQVATSTLNVSTFLDCGNTPFAQTTPLTTQSFGATAFSGSASNTVGACIGNYSLTQVAVLTMPTSANTSFNSDLRVPEPATLALFGVGLLGIGAALRWRRRA